MTRQTAQIRTFRLFSIVGKWGYFTNIYAQNRINPSSHFFFRSSPKSTPQNAPHPANSPFPTLDELPQPQNSLPLRLSTFLPQTPDFLALKTSLKSPNAKVPIYSNFTNVNFNLICIFHNLSIRIHLC